MVANFLNSLVLSVLVAVTLSRCASTPGADNVNSNVLEPAPETKAEQAPTPTYQKLYELLKSLGYEPVGMQYESSGTLDLLHKVFTDPRTSNRRIKLVYTGLQMSYEPNAESITVGGLTNVQAIVAYIQKHVPLIGQELPAKAKAKAKSPTTRSRTLYKGKPVKVKPVIPAKAPKAPAKKEEPVKTPPAAERAPEPSPVDQTPFMESTPSEPAAAPEQPEQAEQPPSNTDSFEIPKDSASPTEQ